MKRFSVSAVAVPAVLAAMAGGQAVAQISAGAYPSKPVVIIVSQAAGGPNDVEARLYATHMSEIIGQKFLVDHKPGAGTLLGTTFVAKARPDGYTLLAVTAGFTIFPALYKDLSFDVIKDFAPILLMSKKAQVIAVRPSFPANNFDEYIAYAKDNPGKINFGHTGAGGAAHLIGAWAHSATKTKVTFIAYKGTPPIVLDMLAGRTDATAMLLFVAMPQVRSGKLRVLAITDDKRSRLLPDVPTVAERGVPGYNFVTWMGFSAPAGTPPAAVSKLGAGFIKVAKLPEVIAALEADGSEVVGSGPAQFGQLIANEVDRWRKVVQEAGIKLEE